MKQRRSLVVVPSALLCALTLAGCNSDSTEGEDAPATAVATSAPTSAPTSTEPATDPATPEITAPSSPVEGDGDTGCLVAGSPWEVSTPDLESQFAGVMKGVNITDISISGAQTLTVTPDLVATFTPNSTVKITADLGGGLTMVLLQKQSGSSTGQWQQAAAGKLTSVSPWEGNIKVSNKVTINGQSSGTSPVDLPAGGLADVPITYSCEDSTLNMTVQGSPFVYLFH